MPWPLPARSVLGFFGKKPERGRVKTRLAAALGAEFARQAYEAMLFDILEFWAHEVPSGRLVLVYDPPDAGPWFDRFVPPRLALQPQVEGSLGERLRGFFEGEISDGASKVVVLGTDSPTLDPSFVLSAFLCLDSRDVVVGPSSDGGYYLLGCRGFYPELFEGIDWSTCRVLDQTASALENSGRSLAVLPPWYDVDTEDDWRMLGGHLRALRLSGLPLSLPRTESLVSQTP